MMDHLTSSKRLGIGREYQIGSEKDYTALAVRAFGVALLQRSSSLHSTHSSSLNSYWFGARSQQSVLWYGGTLDEFTTSG